MKSVLVVSDVRLYREGLEELLRQDSTLAVDTAGRPEETLATADRVAPDVILVDYDMPDGLDLIRQLANSGERVLSLATPLDEDDVIDAAEAGVVGYVTRDSSLSDLVGAITEAADGNVVCPPEIAAALMHRVATVSTAKADEAPSRLTQREEEVASLIREGLTNKEISARLVIGLPTVKNHVHNILEKLQVASRGDAVEMLRLQRARLGNGASRLRGDRRLNGR
jgi:two-component system nitrate/nitrite response regulator NarL